MAAPPTGIASFLERERAEIIEEAESAITRVHGHYESVGADELRRRLELLYDQLLHALETRDLTPMAEYARGLAQARFEKGYDLSEVQAAFNALEEATWRHILAELDARDFAEALGLVSTILGAGKDALARAYVSLAANTHAPSLDLRALFAGTDGV